MKKGYRVLAAAVLMLWTVSLVQASEAASDLKTDKKGKPAESGWGAGAHAGPLSKKVKTVKKAKPGQKATPAVVEKEVWICPMCHIKADKASKCPECGMDMVKMPKDEKKKK